MKFFTKHPSLSALHVYRQYLMRSRCLTAARLLRIRRLLQSRFAVRFMRPFLVRKTSGIVPGFCAGSFVKWWQPMSTLVRDHFQTLFGCTQRTQRSAGQRSHHGYSWFSLILLFQRVRVSPKILLVLKIVRFFIQIAAVSMQRCLAAGRRGQAGSLPHRSKIPQSTEQSQDQNGRQSSTEDGHVASRAARVYGTRFAEQGRLHFDLEHGGQSEWPAQGSAKGFA